MPRVRILAAAACFLLIGQIASAATQIWTAAAAGNWNTAANWNGGAGPVPGSADTADFGTNYAGGTNSNCTLDISPNISGIQFGTYNGTLNLNGQTLSFGSFGFNLNLSTTVLKIIGSGTLAGSGATTLFAYATGGAPSNLEIASGTVTVQGTYTLKGNNNIQVDSGAILHITGSLSIGGKTLTILDNGHASGNGELDVDGSVTIGGGGSLLTWNAGATVNLHARSSFLSGSTSGHFTPGTGTITYDGAAAQSVTALNYWNLTNAGSSTKTLSTGTTQVGANASGNDTGLVVTSTLDLAGQTLSLTNAAPTITGTGTLGNSNAAVGTVSSASTVTVSSTATLTVGLVGGTVTFGGTSGAVTVSSGTMMLASGVTVNGLLTDSSTVDLAGQTLTLALAGSNLAGAGTVTNSTGTGTLAGTITVASGATPTLNATSAVNCSGAWTLTGTLNITGASGVSFLSTLTANNTLTLGGTGTVSVTGNLAGTGAVTFSTAQTLDLSAGFTNTGAFTAGTGTVEEVASGAQTVRGTTYYKLNVLGTGTKTLGGATTVSNALTVNSTLDMNANTLTLSMASPAFSGTGTVGNSNATTATISASSAVTPSSSGTITVGLTGGTVTIGGASGVLTVPSGTTVKLGSNVTVNGTPLTVNGILDLNGSIVTLAAGAPTIAGTGSLGSSSGAGTISSSASVGVSSTGTLTLGVLGGTLSFGGASGAVSATAGTLTLTTGVSIGGTLTVSGTATWNGNGQATTVTGLTTVSAGTYTAGGGTQTYNGGLTVSGGTFTGSTGNLTVSGNFSLSGGTFTAPSSGLFTVSGNWSNTGGVFLNNNGTVTFNGAGASTLTGATTFYNFTCTTGGKQINFPLETAPATQTVNGTLTLTGTSGSLILLRSVTSGLKWSVTVATAQVVNYVDVKDSDALGTTITDFSGTDSGNNNTGIGWIFSGSAFWVGGTGNWSDNTNHWRTTSGGATVASVPGAASAAIFDGNSGGGTCTVNVAVNIEGLTLATGNTTTISQGANTVTVGAGGWLHQAGTFTGGTASITLSGSLNVTGGTFTSTSGTLNVSGNFTNSGTFNHNSGTVQLSGTTATQTLGGGGATFNNVNQSGSAAVEVSSNLTVNGTLTVGGTFEVQGNTLTMSTTSAFAGSGTLTVGANGTLNYALTNFTSPTTVTLDAASTVSYNASANQNVRLLTYGNLTTAGSGTKTLPTGTTTTNGTVTVSTGTTLDLAGQTLSMSGSAMLAGAGTLKNGSGTGTVAGSVTVSSGATPTLNAAAAVSCSGAWTLTGTLTISGASSVSFGSSLTSNNTLTLGGTGTVTVTGNLAGSGAVTFAAAQTLDLTSGFTNTGAFTAGTGTVEEVGSSAQTVRGGITYNNVNILGASTKTLGSSATVSGNLTVNSTLDLSGYTLTLSNASPAFSGTGTIGSSLGSTGTISATAVVTVSSSGTITLGVAGGTFAFGGTSGSVTVSSGKVLAATGFTVGGTTLTVNGTLDLASQTLTLSNGAPTIAGTGTLGSSSGTGTVSAGAAVGLSSTGTLNLGIVGGTVSFGGASGAVNVTSGTILLASAASIVSTLSISGGTWSANGQNTTATGLVTVSTGSYLASTGAQTFNGGLTVSGGTFTGSSGIVAVNGSFTISSGTCTAPSSAGQFTVSGDFVNNGGTFTHNSGTVTFIGGGLSHINGSAGTTFYNFKCESGGQEIDFKNGVTQTVAGTLTLTGASGSNILLRSTSTSRQWTISVTAASQTVTFVDVEDSAATTNTITDYSGVNSLNNTGWIFGTSTFWVGGTGNWSSIAHWSSSSGGASGAPVPASTGAAVFDVNSGGAGTICTIDVAANLGNLVMSGSDVVTLQQGAGTLTVGSGGWDMEGSTFNGGSAAITISGPLTLNAGMFTSTSGTMQVSGDVSISASFTHNNGTVQLTGASGTQNLNAGGKTFNSLNQSGAATVQMLSNASVNGTLTVASTLNVQANTLTMGSASGFAGAGTLQVQAGGTLNVASASFASPTTVTLDTASTVNYNGSASQTVRATTYGNLTVSGTGTATLAAGTTTVNGTLTVSSGTLDLATSTLTLASSNTHTVGNSGTLNMAATASAAPTINFTSTGTLVVNGTFNSTWSSGQTTKPNVTGTAGDTNLQLLGATVNVTGMTYQNDTLTGLLVGRNGTTDATVATFKFVDFKNAKSGGRHLYFQGTAGAMMLGYGCTFDSTFTLGSGHNIRCDTMSGVGTAAVVMASATGAGSGSTYDDDLDGGVGTGWVTWITGGARLTTTPGTGEVRTNLPSTYTGIQGFMTSQYNWYTGNFTDNYLLCRQGTSGGSDLLYAIDNTGQTRGTAYVVSSAQTGGANPGSVVGPPWTATLGNSPGTAEVVIFVTTNGYIFVVQDAVSGGTGTGSFSNYPGFPVQPRNATTYATVVCQAAYSPLLFDAGSDGVAGHTTAGVVDDTDDYFYFTGCDVSPSSLQYNNGYNTANGYAGGANTNTAIRTKCFTPSAQGQCTSGFPVHYGANAAWNWPAIQTLSGTTYMHIATDCDVYSGQTAANQGHIIRVNATLGSIDQNYVSNKNNAALNASPNYNRPRGHTRGGMQIDSTNSYLWIGSYHDQAASPDYSKFFSINTTSTAPATYNDQWAPWGDTSGNDIDSLATSDSTKVYFGDSGGKLHAISQTAGTESAPWPITLETGQAIRCTGVFPNSGNSYLYIGNDNGKVFQVDTNSGAIVNTWHLGDGKMVRTLSIFIDSSNNTYLGVITSDGYEFLLGPF